MTASRTEVLEVAADIAWAEVQRRERVALDGFCRHWMRLSDCPLLNSCHLCSRCVKSTKPCVRS